MERDMMCNRFRQTIALRSLLLHLLSILRCVELLRALRVGFCRDLGLTQDVRSIRRSHRLSINMYSALYCCLLLYLWSCTFLVQFRVCACSKAPALIASSYQPWCLLNLTAQGRRSHCLSSTLLPISSQLLLKLKLKELSFPVRSMLPAEITAFSISISLSLQIHESLKN